MSEPKTYAVTVTDPNGLRVSLRIVGLADVQERIGQEFEQKVRDGLPGVNVYRGTFAP